MIYPVKIKKITSPYGTRKLKDRKPTFHYGIDFTGKNDNAYAVCNCKVVRVLKPDYEYPVRFDANDNFKEIKNIPEGRAWSPYVTLESLIDDSIMFIYKHIDSNLEIDTIIEEGTIIGAIGNFGFSMGKHLHFEVLIKNKNVNPEIWLKENVNK